jgi:hypothetical protein
VSDLRLTNPAGYRRNIGDLTGMIKMKRTSRSIQRKIIRLRAITAHISPYINGLAPETREFVVALNQEAKRLGTGVRFTALANRIEVAGKIEAAARSSTLCGWFIRRALNDGYADGEEIVLRRGNSYWKKHLRKRDKTKLGRQLRAEQDRAIAKRQRARRIVESGDVLFGRDAIIPGTYPKAWIDGVYMPILHPDRRRDDP